MTINNLSNYQICPDGRVISLLRHREMTPILDRYGYEIVCLTTDDGKHRNFKVHRLVAEAYLPNPLLLPHVNHKDENRSNNSLSNLEWVSVKENNTYGGRTQRTAAALSKKVLCVETGKVYSSVKDASSYTGIPATNISKVCLKRPHFLTAGGFHWKYFY